MELLRGTGSPVGRRLTALLSEDAELAVTDVVVAEVLCGARDEGHRDALRGRLLAFPVLPLGGLAGFEAAADLFRSTRGKGVTIRRLADCLIAVPCLQAGARLLHADRDFDELARVTALEIEAI